MNTDTTRFDAVAANIKAAMMAKKLTVPELNILMGRNRDNAAPYMWLQAKTAPHPHHRKLVADLLDLTIEQVTPDPALSRVFRETPEDGLPRVGKQIQDLPRYGHIAAAIRKLIQTQGISASELSRQLGCKSVSASWPWLNAINAPSPEMRRKIHRMFLVPLDDLTPKSPVNGSRSPQAELFTEKVTNVPKTLDNPEPLLTFSILTDGRARLTMDVLLPGDKAWDIMNALHAAGLMPPLDTTEETHEPEEPARSGNRV